jgi:hypothetical protein
MIAQASRLKRQTHFLTSLFHWLAGRPGCTQRFFSAPPGSRRHERSSPMVQPSVAGLAGGRRGHSNGCCRRPSVFLHAQHLWSNLSRRHLFPSPVATTIPSRLLSIGFFPKFLQPPLLKALMTTTVPSLSNRRSSIDHQ